MLKFVCKAARAVTVMALAAAAAGGALAQAYPNKPVRVIVPFAPGGSTDIVARLIATRLSEKLGQPFVVDNRAGAGGNIGSAQAAQAPGDGYTLVVGTLATLVFNPILYKSVGYDPAKDLVPVTMSVNVPFVLTVNPGLGVKDMAGFIALLKDKPTQYNYFSAGAGTSSHLSASLFLRQLGINGVTHVPYKGSAPALADMLGGRITFGIDAVSVLAPTIQSGKLMGLAVAAPQRMSMIPAVPTMAEAGVRGFEASTWNGWFASRGTPKDIVDALAREINAAHQDPQIKARLLEMGAPPFEGFTPESTARFVEQERERWAPVVKASGAQLD